MITNHATGHKAEKLAADYLCRQGFKILHMNWRTKYCEIDIVALKAKTVYFTEVKYRLSSSFGTGREYITSKKLQQMRFAAEIWINSHEVSENYRLAVIEMSGKEPAVTAFLTDI